MFPILYNYVVADSNRRMDKAGKIEQDMLSKKKVKIPKKIFLIGREKIAELLIRYPGLRDSTGLRRR